MRPSRPARGRRTRAATRSARPPPPASTSPTWSSRAPGRPLGRHHARAVKDSCALKHGGLAERVLQCGVQLCASDWLRSRGGMLDAGAMARKEQHPDRPPELNLTFGGDGRSHAGVLGTHPTTQCAPGGRLVTLPWCPLHRPSVPGATSADQRTQRHAIEASSSPATRKAAFRPTNCRQAIGVTCKAGDRSENASSGLRVTKNGRIRLIRSNPGFQDLEAGRLATNVQPRRGRTLNQARQRMGTGAGRRIGSSSRQPTSLTRRCEADPGRNPAILSVVEHFHPRLRRLAVPRRYSFGTPGELLAKHQSVQLESAHVVDSMTQ